MQRFFYSSSACVYNADKQKSFEAPSLKEEDAYPALAEDGYGWEKLFSERMCRHFREDYGLVTRVARFHNVYGPWGTWYGGREKAPAAICRKVIEAKLKGTNEIEIWGTGMQTRSFMYIDDCLKGMDLIMNSDILEPINLGSSEAVSINQVVDIAEEIAQVKLQRKYDLSAPKGVDGRNEFSSYFIGNQALRSAQAWRKLTAGFMTSIWLANAVKPVLFANFLRLLTRSKVHVVQRTLYWFAISNGLTSLECFLPKSR